MQVGIRRAIASQVTRNHQTKQVPLKNSTTIRRAIASQVTRHHQTKQVPLKNSTTLQSNRILNNLWKSNRVDEARKLFDEMPERDEYAWNTMISAYADTGMLDESRRLFDLSPFKSSVTWSGIISGYCKFGLQSEAFNMYLQMQVEGCKPNEFTVGSVLKMCSSSGFLRMGEKVHGFAVKSGFNGNLYVRTVLIDMYAKCRCIVESERLFLMVADSKYHAAWTAMLTGYSQGGECWRAMEFFREMRDRGVESNQFTFPSVLTACGAVLDREFGVQVHGCIVRGGFGANGYVGSALVDMYAKCGDLSSGKRVLESAEVDSEVAWNSMIVGSARMGFQGDVFELFRQMRARNMRIDEYTYPSVLNSFASSKDVENPISVHCLIIKTGFGAYLLVNNALIDMYAKKGKLTCALKVFNDMVEKDVITWTSLVTGCSHNGIYEEAIKLFCDMRTADVCIDQMVVANVLSACAELAVMKFGQQVHGILIQSGLGSSLSVDNSLVAMYAKCGNILDANRVFDAMQARNVITWTALIVGYAQNGRGKESLQFYEQMITTGIKPDYITFIGLLFACSHAGLVESGRQYFESMDKLYGIKPGAEHYACMIDLLGRSGKIAEAKELLNQMVVEPDATIWKALLAACKVHKELDLGEKAAKSLIELEPMNAMPYVLLSNMYSSAGRWEDAAKIRTLMKTRAISKEPGCSWIEKDCEMHVFVSHDRGHPMTTEVYAKIDEIIVLVRKAGYLPDMSYALQDMDEEGKEFGLAYHSEKLAVAFGLITVPEGAPIRIFKNLRVCGDCHSAMKFISKVYLRYIILRDSNCFHHFREGKCSCGDYW